MKGILTFLLFIWALAACTPSEEVQFRITATGSDYLECPVSISIDTLFNRGTDHLALFEIKADGSLQRIPVQYDETSMDNRLWFTLSGLFQRDEARNYVLKSSKTNTKQIQGSLSLDNEDDELRIGNNGNPLLAYRKTPMLPPEDVDTIYQRSAYLHPLYSPGGTLLTNIQPPDHYHHYGIWNPWTKTFIGDREIDYWNLAKGEGTVRTRAVLQSSAGPEFAAFTALQEHIDKKHPDGERVSLDEFWDIRVRKESGESNRYQIDIYSTFRNVTEDTILFEAYRYGGGLGYRARKEWNSENSTVLTSEGLTRGEADGTRAKWCIIEGLSGGNQTTGADMGRSGILFLSHPGNREHPEPMRVWPEDSHEGQLFFEFCPIRHKAWQIIPGTDYQLKYRLIVFDGTIKPAEAEIYWQSFAKPPLPEIIEL